MAIQVIVINGCPGVGKDTFVEHFKNRTINSVENFSMADYVKVTASFLGWNGEKTEKDRNFLSALKDALQEWKDLPYKDVTERINNVIESEQNAYIFVHARESHDIERLVKDFNAFTLLIRRPEVEKNIATNHADLEVFNYCPYDYIYWNIDLGNLDNGTKDFLEIVDKFGKKVEKEN